MIAVNYSKGILNALFHVTGASDKTAAEEKEELIAAGVDWDGYTASAYRAAFIADGYTPLGINYEALEMKRKAAQDLVSASEWWYVTSAGETLSYTNASGTTQEKYFTGYAFKQYETQRKYWPEEAFLALFTTMPDENGAGYAEPSAAGTYMRVDLNEALLTGNQSLSLAAKDEVNGGAKIANGELIVFPEIEGSDWGTIVGFGLFEVDTVGSGTPFFWGRVNEAVAATTAHVPLFRTGDFTVTLK